MRIVSTKIGRVVAHDGGRMPLALLMVTIRIENLSHQKATRLAVLSPRAPASVKDLTAAEGDDRSGHVLDGRTLDASG